MALFRDTLRPQPYGRTRSILIFDNQPCRIAPFTLCLSPSRCIGVPSYGWLRWCWDDDAAEILRFVITAPRLTVMLLVDLVSEPVGLVFEVSG